MWTLPIRDIVRNGVDQATLSRFMRGGGLSLNAVDKLVDVLNLEVRPRRKARKDG